MRTAYLNEARHYWDSARRQARWKQLESTISGKAPKLLDFVEICERLQLRNVHYRGLQNVPLNKIVGSVGRYRDFLEAFLPANSEMEERWERIAAMYIDPLSSPPPIEAYKVGDSYFVRDGNHRVSVANQLELPDIEGYVWEYDIPFDGVPDQIDIDALLIESERHEFLETTHLDEFRPNHDIRVTVPGGYTDLLRQIAEYQQALSIIDERTVPYNEAVIAWYDMVYQTTIAIIKTMDVLKNFPNRTITDIFVWVIRHEDHLEEHYGKVVHITEAVEAVELENLGLLKRAWLQIAKRLPGSKKS